APREPPGFQRQARERSPMIRVRPTGLVAEAWRVEHDGQHIADVRLDIHATGHGEYAITRPDQPGIVWALDRSGPFTFNVWDRGAVLAIVEGVVRRIAPDDNVDITITRPQSRANLIAGAVQKLRAELDQEVQENAAPPRECVVEIGDATLARVDVLAAR